MIFQTLRKSVTLMLFLLVSGFASAQNTITGLVTDGETGLPMPGATIMAAGNLGSVSDENGKYSINVPSEVKTLTFSFIGYFPQEVSINNKSTIDIVLQPNTEELEEVVIIGYGTVKKSDLTGSVSSVKNEELNAFPTANVMQSLSGRSPGVQVKQNTGAPGAPVSVRIRGTNSIQGSNEPLYVIDGFPYSGSNPTVLSNNDIESIEILKDASATAIYGSRGANGVILITTKRGKTGDTTVDFETSYGVQTLRKKIDLLDAKEYMLFYNEQAQNDNLTPYFTQEEINSADQGYDWQDLVFTSAPIKNNNLSINGGSGKTKFSISGTVFDQEGIVKGSNYKKYSLRSYFTQDINNYLSLDYGVTLTRNSIETRDSGGGNRGGSMIGASLSAPPTLTPYNADGSYTVLATAYPFISNVLTNPLNYINEQKNGSVANIVLANAALIFKPVENIQLKIYGGIENNDSRTNNYTSSNFINSAGSASVSASNTRSLLNENTLTYSKKFNGRDQFTALAGATFQNFRYENLGGTGVGFLSDATESYDLSSAEIPGIPSSGYSYSVLLSYLVRLNYTINDKYLFTASVRADGSSKYSQGNKWGIFPSGAFAWRVIEEDFMKNSNVLSDLKFRASYGRTGSQAINAYATLNQLSSGKTIFGDALYNTFAPGTTLPGNLKWETTDQFDIGLDFGFSEDRYRLTLDAYLKNTSDLLNTVQLPSSLGFTRTIQNIGEIQNKGLEISGDAVLTEGKFQWDLSANISFNKTKVVKLYNGQDILGGSVGVTFINDNANLLREGEEMSVFFGYLQNGYDETGREIYQDLSGPEGSPDGIINQFDKSIIGNPNPDFIYGINSSMKYGNFDLTIFFQGTSGNDILNVSAIGNTLDYGFGLNMKKEVLYDHWTPENPDAKYPVISRNLNMRVSDRLIENGSFLRMRNIQLAYNLPVQQLGIKWARSFQVYASGQNLLTFTNYSWWDPEVNSQGGSNSIGQGIDHYSYPTTKSYTFGLKLGL